MQRMTQRYKLALLAFLAMTMGATTASAQSSAVRQANIDYEASGYVTPAGMEHPSLYQGGVLPVGYAMACDGCDTGYGGYGAGSCGPGGCGNGNCGPLGCGGMLGDLSSGCGCGLCGGLASHRLFCIFCQGNGCPVCEACHPLALGSCLKKLLPYTRAGLCAQRWYDLSAEAVFLGHTNGGVNGALTSRGASGPIVLSTGDAGSGDDLEAGIRLSGALICGVGGNIEGTYMGGNQWNSSASVIGTADLFSVISDFGVTPTAGGFADTDSQDSQQVSIASEFHSAELNYRRRWMGPYCRFQGSWLAGLRYLRYEDGLRYSGTGAGGSFIIDDQLTNGMFGVQGGFDLWWNLCPGINLGMGMKGGWVENKVGRDTRYQTFIVPIDQSFDDTKHNDTVFGEFEAKMIYRFSHSWSFRTAYYALAVDDVGFGVVDADSIFNTFQGSPPQPPRSQTNSLVVQGFSFGTEYLW
ncbi:MAG: hypothetical protein P1U77_01815 [Rubripirellula sp.]|nr:hypothetical protein [Planctomycetaceae bacterium]MDF1840139.1 hypothetical protein [Rubripirellula sp.]